MIWLRWGLLGAALMLCPVVAQAHNWYGSSTPPTQFKALTDCNNDGGGCSGPHSDATGKYYQRLHDGGQWHLFLFDSIVCPDPAQPPNADGTCGGPPPATPEHCASLQAQTSGVGNDLLQTWSGTFPQCRGGCSFGPTGPTTSWTIAGVTLTNADFGFTGGTCSTPAPSFPPPAVKPPDPVDPVCTTTTAPQQMCVMQTGQQCYTASTGRMICWNKGETGTKTDGAVAQKRCPGSAACTTPTPPPGETFSAPGTSVTHVTNTTVNNVTTTSTTTTNNFTTTYGTNAGGDNQGQPAGGNPGTTTAAGGDTATGGSCTAPYVTSGDGLQAAQLNELRQIRCAQNGGDAVVGALDCSVPFNVTGGDKVAVQALKETHEARCADKALRDAIAGGEGTDGGDGATGADAFGEAEDLGSSVLNLDGFLGGSRSCPAQDYQMPNGTLKLAEAICPGTDILAFYMMLLAYMHCMWILGGAAARSF